MKALGMIEIQSIPAGVEAGDQMLKTASVELVAAQAVCAGKYIVIIAGEVAAVRSSVKAGEETAGSLLINSIVIPAVHEQVPKAINACTEIDHVQAVGVMETFSLCSAVIAADASVKAAEVDLIEVRLGRGLGGKSFIVLTGEVAAVRAAIEAGTAPEEVQGLMSRSVVIPSPHPDIVRSLL